MSLEKINLPPGVLAGLYKDHIVIAETTEPKKSRPESKKKTGYRFLGENARRILVLVNYPNYDFLADSDLEFLTRMLTACKLSLGDVAIINHAAEPIVFEKIKKQFNPVTAISFGLSPETIGLPLNFPQYQSQLYDSCTHLYAPAFDEIIVETEAGKLHKSKLWVSLRKLFNV